MSPPTKNGGGGGGVLMNQNSFHAENVAGITTLKQKHGTA